MYQKTYVLDFQNVKLFRFLLMSVLSDIAEIRTICGPKNARTLRYLCATWLFFFPEAFPIFSADPLSAEDRLKVWLDIKKSNLR